MRLDAPLAPTSTIVVTPAPADFRAAAAQLDSLRSTLKVLDGGERNGSRIFGTAHVMPTLERALGQARAAVHMLSQSSDAGAYNFRYGIEQSVIGSIEFAKATLGSGGQPAETLGVVDAASNSAQAFAAALRTGTSVVEN